MYFKYMESTNEQPDTNIFEVNADLRNILTREKEALVSMFLASASLAQLNSQYKLIHDLNEKIHIRNREVH